MSMREKIAEVIDVNYNVSAWLDVDNSEEIADANLAALPECIKPQ
jgi:hypothetical protein